MKKELLNSLWVEKYRPKNLSELIINEEYLNKFQSFIDNKIIPHILLAGNPGTGKSTISNILCDYILEDTNNLLEINGSSNNGIDYVRTQIIDFITGPIFSNDLVKIIHISEADGLTIQAQNALKDIFETYHDSGRFIFTVNNINKISDPIKSRMQIFNFKNLPKNIIKEHVVNILNKENVEFEDESVNKLITLYYPDVRRILGTIQSRVVNGNLTEKTKEDSQEFEILKLIENSFVDDEVDFTDLEDKITNIVSKYDIDFVYFYELSLKSSLLSFYSKFEITNSYNNHNTCMNPYINFMGLIYKLIIDIEKNRSFLL